MQSTEEIKEIGIWIGIYGVNVKPDDICTNAGVYRYSWNGSHGINIRIDRLRESKGRLDAEITVNSLVGRIYHSVINLLYAKARKEVASACRAKKADTNWEDFPWEDAIDDVCLLTLEKHREGEPVSSIGNLPVGDKHKHLLYSLLVENQANLIYGAGGTCKSFLSAFICLLLESGESMCRLKPSRKARPLYLDFETSREEINDRLQMLKKGASLSEDINILYRFCHQPLAADIMGIQRIVVENDIEFVVVDSYGMACGGEPESADMARQFFMALRSLRITTLTIDHVAKGNAKGPFGSVYKVNEARNVWEIKSAQEPGEGFTEVGLFHRKMNNGRLLKPLGYKFSFIDNEGVIVEDIDVRGNAVLASELSWRDRIAELLRRGSMKASDIAKELDTTEGNIRTTLNRNKDYMFVKLMDGHWGLAMKDKT